MNEFRKVFKQYGDKYSNAIIYISFVIISLIVAVVLFGILHSTGAAKIAFVGTVKEAEFGGAFTGFIVTLILLIRYYSKLNKEKPNITIKGNVLFPDDRPVKDAIVFVEGIDRIKETDLVGWFEIEVDPQENWKVRATYLKETTEKIINKKDIKKPVCLKLEKNPIDEGKKNDIQNLINQIEGGSTEERIKAINALCASKENKAVDIIENILKNDTNIEVRIAAAHALGRTGNKNVVKTLLTILKQERWVLAHAVIESIGALGDSSAIPELKRTVYTGDWAMAQRAVQSIAKLGNGESEITKILVDVLDSEHEPWVQEAAIQALTNEYKDTSPQLLLKALDSDSKRVRYWAARAIGNFFNKKYVNLLEERLKHEGDDRVIKELKRAIELINNN